jgi:CheY-like chemotaxis protein
MEAGPKTVVVAEDEILIRILAADVLTEAGFDVIEVGNADEALTPLQSRLGQSIFFSRIFTCPAR